MGNNGRSHLVLALNTKGIGELWLGLRVAMDLKAAGDSVSFLTLEGNAMPLRGSFPFSTFKLATSPLLPFLVERRIRGAQSASIIFADYLTCSVFLRTNGMTPATFQRIGVPIIAIDTWDSSRTPETIDCFIDDVERVPQWRDSVTPICPVPFLSPDTPGAYQSLPQMTVAPRKVRKHLRHTLGLSDRHKAVLFCTAKWQHMPFRSDSGRRLAASLPRLLAEYLSEIDETVHLVHVGPEPYPLGDCLHERYHWVAQVPPREFDLLVSSMDLLVSANIAATTIAKAMVAKVPTLVLQNSFSGASVEEVEQNVGRTLAERSREWVRASAPIYPFALWPVGYHRFLAPVLRDNPYSGAFQVVEVLDEDALKAALAALTLDRTARDAQLHLHAAYLARIEACPTAAERVLAHC